MRKAFRLLVAAGLVAFAAVGPVGASAGNPDKDCGGGRKVTFSGPDSAWPPNHKPVTETITYSGGMPGETLTTAGSDDEETKDAEGNYVSEEPGSGHTDTASDVSPRTRTQSVDAQGDDVNNSHDIRAERAGTGDGRTYTLHYAVDAVSGQSLCMGDFTVNVPHDMGGGNDK